MTLQDKQWLDARPYILGNVRITPEDNRELFAIYNRLTGETMKVTSCGRCVANVKKTIKHYYDQERSNN
jgi:hypothetical protein